ncbi:MAG: enoyl-CoA hydratase/isomerase family protein [Cyanobacteria bacterium P01_G01_bin.54]
MQLSPPIAYQLKAGVAEITLANPDNGNALSPALIAALSNAIAQANSDVACRVIVLLAQGDAFCQGLDLPSLCRADGSFDGALLEQLMIGLKTLYASPKPTIACVEGPATGGGVGLVAACDLVLATDAASFQLSEVIVGMIPALIAPFLLRRLTPARLNYLTLSSRRLDAAQAQQWGLVDEVSSALPKTLRRQLKQLFRSSPAAIAQSKAYFERLNPADLDQQLAIAQETLLTWLAQPETVAGIQQFAEGFSPPWFATYRPQ